jgi:hypothetical protein
MCPCHAGRMINRHPSSKPKSRPRIVACFGRASLVRVTGSNYELRDAVAGELTAAKEWVSLFRHEALLDEAPVAQSRETSNSRWNVSSFGRSE